MFIGYYKPSKDDDDWPGGNTWPVLNLPGKGESTRRVNHWTEGCPPEQLGKEQSVKNTGALSLHQAGVDNPASKAELGAATYFSWKEIGNNLCNVYAMYKCTYAWPVVECNLYMTKRAQ